jgi:tetratricopeptide (TPR) repeat protein
MIDKDGNARIMDFGIARSLKAKGITGAGVMIGTPEYMSPEQVEGKEIDQRSDIYSLGVILFEMMTGRVPFEGDTSLSIALMHKTEIPPDPREFNTQIPVDLSRLILRCMEKDKERRYQGAEEVLAELTKIEKGIPTSERVVPKKKPVASKEITVIFGLKKLFIPALVVLALIIAAVVIWQFLPKEKAVPIPADKSSLAIMYFKNNTGDESFDIWRSALSDSIITDLSQSKFIWVLSADRLYSILRKLNLLETKSYATEDLKKVAFEGGVNHILQGGLSKAGDDFRIDYTLQEINTGETIGSDKVEGSGAESIFSMVDELTRKIKANFKLSPGKLAGDIDKEVGTITTSSLEALNHYIQGKRYYNEKKFEKSIEQLMIAVDIDSEFAMAYKMIALSYGYLRYPKEVSKYFGKALELQNRVSDREGYLIQGDYFNSVERAFAKAIETYQELLNLYPDDEEAKLRLGAIYYHLEEWDQAIEWYNKVLKTNNRSEKAYQNLAYIYGAKGWHDQARSILQANKDIFSSEVYFYRNMGHAYLYQGRYNLALTEVQKALSLAPDEYRNIALMGNIYHVKGDLLSAKKTYQQLIKKNDALSQLEGRRWMSHLHLLQGQYNKCMDEIIEGITQSQKSNLKQHESKFMLFLAYLKLRLNRLAEALDVINQAMEIALEFNRVKEQKLALHLRGLAYLKMKQMDEAKKTGDQLKQLIEETENKKHMRHYYHLMGMIALENNQANKSIEDFTKAVSLLPSEVYDLQDQSFYIDSLASAYYKTGNIEEAEKHSVRIVSLTWGLVQYGDIYARSFYWLGKIFQEKGLANEAIEHYKKFLSLWRDADSGHEETADAKEQLAVLGNLSQE